MQNSEKDSLCFCARLSCCGFAVLGGGLPDSCREAVAGRQFIEAFLTLLVGRQAFVLAQKLGLDAVLHLDAVDGLLALHGFTTSSRERRISSSCNVTSAEIVAESAGFGNGRG